jgi:putative two-component system response regulator
MPVKPGASAANSVQGPGMSARILILDDAELNNVLMTEAVRGIEGAEPKTFTEPRLALEFVEAHAAEIGVAVTDFDMPGMTGLEFIRAARKVPDFEHVPIVMVTSLDQRQVRREALAAGATDFMGKPFDGIEVKARIGNLLALNQARREQQDRAAWLAREVAAAVSVIEAREREIVARLVKATERRDTDTGNHVFRVASYARLIAASLGHSPAWCDQIELASTMHDIGKIGIPDAILLKRGPLSSEERKLMASHAEEGRRILEGSSSEVVQLAADIAISHHERWDGEGYPRGLRGEEIPLCGRIVAIADVFDALTSARPYKAAWPFAQARAYLIENSGTQFDPRCVRAFLDRWPHVLDIIEGRAPAAAA